MPPHEWIAQYGALLVFLNVLGASLGLPLPVMPTLIAVGACHAVQPAGSWVAAMPLCLMLGAAVVAATAAALAVWRADPPRRPTPPYAGDGSAPHAGDGPAAGVGS